MASQTNVIPLIDPLHELQKAYCLVKLSGELRVADRQQIAEVLAGRQSGHVDFYKAADATKLMARFLEALAAPSKPKQVIEAFWVSPATHVYDAVAFSPLSQPATTLNYWVPCPVVPAQGDWSIIRLFLLVVLCNGNRALFDYLLRYIAHMLQRPEEKPGVMLVFLGGQGTGKGTFFVLLRRLWPRTTLQVSDVDYVVGQFNAALERNYVICMDEALFAGDRKARDRLKSLVTDSPITIEQKYQPRRSIESFHRFVAASNHDHFANVEADDRRFVFFRVSDKHQEDLVYFAALHAALDDPAVISAMVHDLLVLDLSGFNVRERPKTAEHTKQKLKSLQGFDRYWHEVLQAGDFCVGDPSGFTKVWDQPCFISTSDLRAGCQNFHKSVRQFQTLQEQDIHASLEKLCPDARRDRTTSPHGKQVRGFQLPELSVARGTFAAAIGGKVDWHFGDDEARDGQ